MKKKFHVINSTYKGICDITFLTLILSLSSIFYIFQIGIYSDDWAFLSTLHLASDKSLLNLIELFLSMAPDTSYRPVKSIYQASLYYFFDLDQIYYHMVNHLVLLGNAILVFVILKKLKIDPVVALAVAIIFVLLPNYSTLRYWYAAFQGSICILFYLLSLYIDLRNLDSTHVKFWAWKLVSLFFISLSVLAYEIVFPLYILNILIIYILPRNYSSKESPAKVKTNSTKIIVLNIILLILLLIFKLSSTNLTNGADYLTNIKSVFSGIFNIYLIEYGLLIPQKILLSLKNTQNPYLLISSSAISVLIFSYIYSVSNKTDFSGLRGAFFLKLISIGLIILLLGYFVAFYTSNVSFTLAGVNNRTAMAATIGMAIIMVGAIGLICSIFNNNKLKKIIFSLLVAIISFFGITTNNYISEFWIDAYEQQLSVVESLNKQKPEINKNSTIIIDGICPYVGPGIVFEAYWDVEGMYAIYFKDYFLKGDIIRFNTQVNEKTIFTSVYGVDNHYYYGDKLYVFNYKLNKIYKLNSFKQAQTYFDDNFDNINDCPVAYEGTGMKIFY